MSHVDWAGAVTPSRHDKTVGVSSASIDRGLRFGAYILQDAPLPVLRERWREAEALGFNQIWLADHTRDFRRDGPWFDAWATLAVMAVETSDIRIGTLVTNPILRPPAVLARVAATVDAFSQGRLELGIGTGIAAFDHEATGTPHWPIAERLGRFREYVTIVDELFRRAPAPIHVDGQYLSSRGLALEPTAQRPRPPLILGGQSPAVLRLVAERADGWNTHGPFGASPQEILEVTGHQNVRLDGLCETANRDPAAVRRSLLMYDALDAWATADAFDRTVESFAEIGMREFVVFWPRDDQRPLFERALASIARLRS